jgi:hypothetical protein
MFFPRGMPARRVRSARHSDADIAAAFPFSSEALAAAAVANSVNLQYVAEDPAQYVAEEQAVRTGKMSTFDSIHLDCLTTSYYMYM